jgi:hypothetical protein
VRKTGISGQGDDERLDAGGVAAAQAAACANERDELPGHRPIGPHRRHGPAGGPKPRLEPYDHLGVIPRELVDRPVIAA